MRDAGGKANALIYKGLLLGRNPVQYQQILRSLRQFTLQLFDASRPAEGSFTKERLEESRQQLLSTIARWFHDLYEEAVNTSWQSEIVDRLRRENAAIVSFNWDLILDQLLFSAGVDSESYGLSKVLGSGPVLLKPHGSLN